MNHEVEMEIFRAGEYGPKGKWSEATLEQMAADYDPATHEAPLTLDHAQTGPALGWVAGLKRSGDKLVARVARMSDGLIELLRQGAFKKRSVEIYGQLPETGKPYLKAVSFLGAAAPAVKGLNDVLFSEGVTNFQRELGEYCAFDFGEMPGIARSESRDPESDGPKGSKTAAVAFDELKEELRGAGRWAPWWETLGIREFFAALSAVDEIEVESDRSVGAGKWFADFLKSLPPHLPMGEAARAPGHAADVSLPRGGSVSPESIELHRRALAFQSERPGICYAEALRESARG